MQIDWSSMIFFRNASYVCLTVAAIAMLAALIMFFVFDIRTIFMIRIGMAGNAAMRMKTCTVKEKKTEQEISFRLVRKIVITDADVLIDPQDTLTGRG